MWKEGVAAYFQVLSCQILEGLMKTTNTSIRIVAVLAEILKRSFRDTRQEALPPERNCSVLFILFLTTLIR
jgi:hypothetical protein